jgi:hypothetical protein
MERSVVAGNNFNIGQVKLNGVAYGTKPGPTAELGGLSFEADYADGEIAGYLGTPVPMKVDCGFILNADSDVEAVRNFRGILEFVLLDVPGKPIWSSSNAVIQVPPGMKPGDGLTCTFIGTAMKKTN